MGTSWSWIRGRREQQNAGAQRVCAVTGTSTMMYIIYNQTFFVNFDLLLVEPRVGAQYVPSKFRRAVYLINQTLRQGFDF